MTIKQYLVVDDSEQDVELLTQRLDKFTFYKSVGAVSTIEAALNMLATQRIDLIFLDVHLPNQSGMTLLKIGATLPPVIIISAYPEYAVDSYEIGRAADYLLKPYTDERLHMALNRASQLQSQNQPSLTDEAIFLKMGRRIQRFDFRSILYVEAFGIYSKVYADEQLFVVNERLSAMTQLLPARLFIRIHKSYLINLGKITSYDRHSIYLGKTQLPIGISYRPRLEGLLALFDGSDDS
ncbi:LytR/AlgR family response regulator transcription factor [Fibrella aquatilis]|uniref:Response regulator transcription factor n=1 Tax=Fibrella aquatilis TaxID=2817059 RepID=A0A939G6T1_9BACT|nr:LytTR family DNA-binding domain-containing protein [Fibrella aquatilis]MBO0933229.1 response regulator transcription factor [Fibrella aquatilis]